MTENHDVRRDVMSVLNSADFGSFDVQDMEVNEHADGTVHVTADVIDVESNANNNFLASRPIREIMSEKEVIGIRDGKVRFLFY
jgi:hypothetical protein